MIIAPEGRYSLIDGLEQGGGGAAWLALQSGAPVIPIALTGTRNEAVYGSLRRGRRPHLTLTVGEPFHLLGPDNPQSVRAGTRRIMDTLARMLPPDYRGVYANASGL